MESDFLKEIELVKSEGEDKYQISGIASSYGNADSYGEIFEDGSFDEVLGKEVLLMTNHSRRIEDAVGKVKFYQEGKLIKFTGELLKGDPAAEKIAEMKASKYPLKTSIGGMRKDYKWEERKGKTYLVTTKADIFELSIVLQGANPKAKVEKNLNNENQEGKMEKQILELLMGIEKRIGENKSEELTKSIADLKATLEKAANKDELEALKKTVEKMDEELRKATTPGATSKEESLEKAMGDYAAIIKEANTTTGASVIPKPLSNKMIKDMKEIAPFLNEAFVFKKGTGSTLQVPVRKPNATSSAKNKEEGKATANGEINLSHIILTVGVKQSVIPITDEFRRDSAFEATQIVREYATEDIAEMIAQDTVNGVIGESSVNKIEGFENNTNFMTNRTTAYGAAITEITWETIVAMKEKIKPQYRSGMKYYITPAMETHMATMKDNNGRPLWLPSVIEGTPSKFNGIPVVVMEQMSDKLPVLLANFKKFYYYLLDYDMERESDRKAIEGYNSEIARTRIGGRVANEFAGYGLKK